MSFEQWLVVSLALGIVAFLYSSVGHAGASGYIAVMTLAHFEPHVIKPTALTLNVFVASIATWQFVGRRHFSWKLLWPFALLAVPLAFLGGYWNLPTKLFNGLVGGVLLFSAIRFLVRPADLPPLGPPARTVAIPVGAGLGLLSGLTGTGGGIFLTPLLLISRWANAKTAAGVSAVFILLNSVAGLTGNLSSTRHLPMLVIPMLIVVIVGGTAGSYLGSQRFQPTTIKRLLAAVLFIASTKLLVGAALAQADAQDQGQPETFENRHVTYPEVGDAPHGVVWPVGQALPTFAAPAIRLDTIEVQDLSVDERITFSALQGLVNHHQPRRLLLDARSDEGRDTWPDTPTVGLGNRTIFRRSDRFQIVAKYAAEVHGIVLYDPNGNPVDCWTRPFAELTLVG